MKTILLSASILACVFYAIYIAWAENCSFDFQAHEVVIVTLTPTEGSLDGHRKLVFGPENRNLTTQPAHSFRIRSEPIEYPGVGEFETERFMLYKTNDDQPIRICPFFEPAAHGPEQGRGSGRPRVDYLSSTITPHADSDRCVWNSPHRTVCEPAEPQPSSKKTSKNALLRRVTSSMGRRTRPDLPSASDQDCLVTLPVCGRKDRVYLFNQYLRRYLRPGPGGVFRLGSQRYPFRLRVLDRREAYHFRI